MSMDEEDEPKGGFGLQEIVAIFWRRRYWLVAPLVVATIASSIYAWLADPVYESTATILIESQQIPTSLVASPVTSFADERIAKIRQQILARGTLIELINKNGLYPEDRAKKQLSDVVAIMKDAIKVDLVSANVGAGGASKANATIAFNLTFAYDNPLITQKVAEQLMGMFIDADIRRRTEQASGTAGFLTRRAEELRARLMKQEEAITAVRQRYNGALPEQLVMSSSSAATLRGEIARIDAEIQGVMQANAVLAGKMEDQAALPDGSAQSELARAQANLDRVEALYTDSHPDVIAARGVVERLRQSARLSGSRGGTSAVTAELNAGRSRIAMLNQRRAELSGNVAMADRLVAASPQAAHELNNLQRDYDNLNQQYQSIRDRQLEAQVAANLETEEKGERFTAVDPPAFPEEPVRPNRLLLILMGVGAGAGLGLGLILLLEIITAPIHGAGGVQRLTGELPLAAIPVMKSGPQESALGWLDRLILWRRRLRAG